MERAPCYDSFQALGWQEQAGRGRLGTSESSESGLKTPAHASARCLHLHAFFSSASVQSGRQVGVIY